MALRGDYLHDDEQFFVFRDGSPVKPQYARNILQRVIRQLNLNDKLYGMHSFRIGRTSDLIKYNYSIDEVKLMGRWKSNVVLSRMVG